MSADRLRAMLASWPERESPYTEHLPYAEDVREESKEAFAHILRSLDEAISKRNLSAVGTVLKWIFSFLDLHNFAFSLTDQVHLIQVLYALLPHEAVRTAATNLLIHLLDWRYISPSSLSAAGVRLELDWHTLYDAVAEESFAKHRNIVKRVPDGKLLKLARLANPYFSASSTQEITALMLPPMAPGRTNREESVFCYFLPTHPLSHAASSADFLSWLPAVMKLHESISMQGYLLMLISDAVFDNIGRIDVTPHYAYFFSLALKFTNVPVGQTAVFSTSSIDVESMTVSLSNLLVGLIGPDGVAMDMLARLLTSVASFFHPSNNGTWSDRLSSLANQLCQAYSGRLFDELRGLMPIPDSHKLTAAQHERFVAIMLEPLTYLMHSKNPVHVNRAVNAARMLLYVAPARIAPALLETISSILETAPDMMQVAGALGAVVGLGPVLVDPLQYPDGLQHFTSLVTLALPHININSPHKALAALSALKHLFAVVPLVDCSGLPPPSDLPESLAKAWDNTQFVEDLVLQSVDRMLELLEVPLNHRSTDLFVTSLLQRCAMVIRQQASQAILDLVWEKIKVWAEEHRELASLKPLGYMIAVSIGDNPTRAVAFVQDLCKAIIAEASGQPTVTDVNADENHTPGQILWHLGLLNAVATRSAPHLLPIAPLLFEVLDKTLYLACKPAAKMAGKVFRHLLRGLTEYRLHSTNTPVTPDTFLDFLRKGPLGAPADFPKVQHYTPSHADLRFAEDLLARYYPIALDYVRSVVVGTNAEWATLLEVNKRLVLRSHLCVLRNAIRSPALFPEEDLPRVNVHDSDACWVPLTPFAWHNGLPKALPGTSQRRGEVFAVVHAAIDHLLSTREDDVKALKTLAKIADVMLTFRGFREQLLSGLRRDLSNIKAYLSHSHLGHLHTRATFFYRLWVQHLSRQAEATRVVPLHEHHLALIGDLYRLSLAPYPKLREAAQGLLSSALAHHQPARRVILLRAIGDLRRAAAIPAALQAADVPAVGVGVGGQAGIPAHEATQSGADGVPPTDASIAEKLSPEEGNSLATAKPVGDGAAAAVTPLSRAALKGLLHVLRMDRLCRIKSAAVLQDLCAAVAPLSEHRDKKIQGLVHEFFKSLTKRLPFHFHYPAAAFSATLFEALVALHPPAETHRELYLTESLRAWMPYEENQSRKLDSLMSALLALCRSLRPHWLYELMIASVLSRVSATQDRADVLEYFMEGIASVQLAALSIDSAVFTLRYFKASAPRAAQILPPSMTTAEAIASVGVRDDNLGLQHRLGAELTGEEYAAAAFVDKIEFGWNALFPWSPYLPLAERTGPASNPMHVRVAMAVLTPEWIDALLSREGSSLGTKASLTFKPTMVVLYTKLFRLGPAVFERFRPKLDALCGPGSTPQQHRCASEIVAGLVRGSRHWPVADLQAMWDWLLPFLQRGWALMTSETQAMWPTSLFTMLGRTDSRRYTRLARVLLAQVTDAIAPSAAESAAAAMTVTSSDVRDSAAEKGAPGSLAGPARTAKDADESDGSGVSGAGPLDAPSALVARLDLLSSMVFSLSWKGTELSTLLLSQLPHHAGQEFKTVRRMIAHVLYAALQTLTFALDATTPAAVEQARTLNQFLTFVHESLTISSFADLPPARINLIKTILAALPKCLSRYHHCMLAPVTQIVARLLVLPIETSADADLPALLTAAISAASKIQFRSQYAALLDTCDACVSSATWHAKMRLVSFIQVSLFANLFDVPDGRALRVLQPLLSDEHVEVRNGASKALSGLVRCGLVDPERLVSLLATWAGPTLKAKPGLVSGMTPSERASLVTRHAGVLGLRALVEAFPYSVPRWMPDVLVKFCLHVSDVEPIGSTVRTGMSEFWRTHREGWEKTKELFSETQLDAVTNTLISPWYFA